MSMHDSLLRALLRLAPASFRAQYGAELMETYRERHARAAERGRLAVRVHELAELAGVVVLVLRLRLGREPAAALNRSGRLDALGQDVRFAFRGLRRNPGYALGALLVLGIGIGANTAMFSAVNAFFFRPLPFAEEDRVVMLYETNPEFEWTHAEAAPANVLDWRERVRGFEDVAAYSELSLQRVPYVHNGEPTLIAVTHVTGNFFSVLGARPLLGRSLSWEETWEGRNNAVVISHDLWQTHFGADPGIVGRVITVGARDVEVAGVMPASFSFPNDETQLWATWGWTADSYDQVFFRRAHWVRPIARLADGVSFAQAEAELQTVVRQLQVEFPETNRIMGAGMMPARDFLIRDVRRPLLILLGAVALLLLLSCANVANLALVRASERVREVAVRHALGAGRARIAAQMLTESVVLALAGGVLGLAIGWAGVRMMEQLTPLGIAGATSVALDARVLLFTFLAAAVSGVMFGIAPAVRSMRGSAFGALAEEGRSGTRSRRGARTANALVGAEVALALLLVAAAGLMIQSFQHIRSVDPGFRTAGVVAVHFTLPAARYPEGPQVAAFYHRLQELLEARGGIERVGVVAQLPLNGTSWSSQFQARGWPPERVGLEILHRRADAGYFDALDIRLLRGRMFNETDRTDGPLVVLINETFARQHFPNEDPIGQRIAYDRVPTDSSAWYEIIGIVADQQQVSPTQPARAEVFEHRDQDWARGNWVVVRSSEPDAAAVVPAIRGALRELDPLIPIAEVRTLDDVRRESVAREQFILTLLTIFGGAALLLATVGVYAVTAQTARKRTREIGIRMALGAAGSSVAALMLRQSLAVVAVGIGVGLAVSLLAMRALGSLLFEVEPTDPLTLATVSLLLGGVAALACYLPAWRATRVDPAGVLKDG